MENRLRGAQERKKTIEIKTRIMFVFLLLLRLLNSFPAGTPSFIFIALAVVSLNLE